MAVEVPALRAVDLPEPRRRGFEDPVVEVRQVDDKDWAILKKLDYHASTQDFQVPKEEETDFASVPRVFAWFLPRYGRYTPAAILHDHLWKVEVRDGNLSLRDADGIFRQAMRELGVPFLRRWIMWAAVRWGALSKPGGRRDWLGEAPRVLLVTLLALPIVAPAAAVILLTLPIFYLFELLVWVPLKVSQRVKARRGEGIEKVNKPALRLKM
jgi:hypothetical protein